MARGFTLIELVVVIVILAVLATVAVPKFIDMSRSARVASVAAMAGTLQTAAEHVHMMCQLDPICRASSDQASHYEYIGGQGAVLAWEGWPAAGDSIGHNEIDIWVTTSGFTVTLFSYQHLFTVPDAPDPSQCAVVYGNPSASAAPHGTSITQRTSGC